MTAILLSTVTFFSTSLGGLFALRHRDRLHLILGFTAGVLVGLVAFDLLPEIFRLVRTQHLDATGPMVAVIAGFLVFHIAEQTILIHHAHEEQYAEHSHPTVGVLSAAALSGHSFLDGVGIGIGFKVSTAAGVAVAVAVIGHDFADGLNTVTLMLTNKNSRRDALGMLLVDATTPILGAASTLLFSISNNALPFYLGFFTGFLLYIGASDILPEAHREGSSWPTVLLTILGTGFAFLVTRFT
ncbi:MAG: ZIP family metal transporter [Chloroflexota bacterium]